MLTLKAEGKIPGKMNWLKRVKIILLSILYAIISISCGSGNNPQSADVRQQDAPDKTYPITFTPGKQISLDIVTKGDGMFEPIQDNNTLYFGFGNTDGDLEIRKFDRSLNFLGTVIIKHGQGPSEALNPWIVGGTKQEIICYDLLYKRFLYWKSDFKSCTMEKRVLFDRQTMYHSEQYSPELDLLIFLENYNAYRSLISELTVKSKSVKKRGGGEVHYYGIEYQRKKKNADGKMHYWLSVPIHAFLHDRFVYVINLQEYRIFKFGINGKLLDNTKIPFTAKSFPDAVTRPWVKARNPNTRHSQLFHYPEELWPACWMLPLGNGFAVGRREDYKPNDQEWIPADYFDFDLNYLGKIRLPRFSKWNCPMYGPAEVEDLIKIIGNQAFYISRDEDEECFIIKEWLWKDEKRPDKTVRKGQKL